MGEKRPDKSIADEIGDWEAAIDEWDANLELPTTERAQSATPAMGVPLLRPPAEEPPPLSPLAGSEGADPLMQLFDGEMELPEEAGQALGDLLGAEEEAAVLLAEPTTPEPALPSDHDSPFGASTRVAKAGEFDQLLADSVEVDPETSRLPRVDPIDDFLADEIERGLPPSSFGPPTDPFTEEAAVDVIIDTPVLSSAPPPEQPPKKSVSPTVPLPEEEEDFYDDIVVETGSEVSGAEAEAEEKGGSGQLPPSAARERTEEGAGTAAAAEGTATPAGAEADRTATPAAAEIDRTAVGRADPFAEEVAVEEEPNPPPAALDTEVTRRTAPPAGAEDEATRKTAPPEAANVADDEALFIEPPLILSEALADPIEDQAPVPAARATGIEAASPVELATAIHDPTAAAPATAIHDPAAAEPATAIHDPAAAEPATVIHDPAAAEPATVIHDPAAMPPAERPVDEDLSPLPPARSPNDPAYLREQLALYDAERRLTPDDERARIARLAAAAARVAERLGDRFSAKERYQTALKADPEHPQAQRGLWRLSLTDGELAPALSPTNGNTPEERRGLRAIAAERALVAGDRVAARAAYEGTLAEDSTDLGSLTGLCDLAAPEELPETLARLAGALSADSRGRAALIVERARLAEAAGEDAAASFVEALRLDPRAIAAAWGQWRAAVSAGDSKALAEAHASLIELVPTGSLRVALERQLGRLRAGGDELAEARSALQRAGAAGDRLALESLFELERASGRHEEAMAVLTQWIEGQADAGRRADRLVILGGLAERQQKFAEAAAAYMRALTEDPVDPRAARALERKQAANDDKTLALQHHLQVAERSPERSSMEFTYAARLLRDLGREDEARAKLQTALTAAPLLGPAIDLAVELELAAGRPVEAAAVLARAADQAVDARLAQSFRDRGARLLLRAGRAGDALALARPLLQLDTGSRASRWLEQLILRAAEGQADALRDSLQAEAHAAEAAAEGSRAAAVWHELALLAPEEAEAVAALQRALSLDPADAAAGLEWAARVNERDVELPALYRLRLTAAGKRPEAAALLFRLGTSLLEDARDGAAAEQAFAEAAQLSPGLEAASQGRDRAARGTGGGRLAVLERELGAVAGSEFAFALEMEVGDQLAPARPQRAVEHYRRALAQRPGVRVARAALERALLAAHDLAALTELALEDLKLATTPEAKIAAYGRLAYLDGELRGDRESALFAWQSIFDLDSTHQLALRQLEKAHLGQQRWPELIALYDRWEPRSDANLWVAVCLQRARLRLASGGDEGAVEADFRQALTVDPRCRPALLYAYGRARGGGASAARAELAIALAETTPQDGRAAAVMLTRAAEAAAAPAETGACYRAALERSSSHVPALLGLTHHALAESDWAGASWAAERTALALRDVATQSQYFLVAGALAQERLEGFAERVVRAQALLRAALAADSGSVEAFSRLERLLEGADDFAALAELYRQRLSVEPDGARRAQLRLSLARVCRDKLGDPARAQVELQAMLAEQPTHPEALRTLSELRFAAGQWAEAAELLICRARLEKSRQGLKEIFSQLGTIYAEHLPAPQRAITAFSRVLQFAPDNKEALAQLSTLYLRTASHRNAVQVTTRLIELEADVPTQIRYLHRLAKIYEDGLKDSRHAIEALRRALELDPLYLPSVRELAQFFDRQSDVQSMRVHLDRTAARVRQQIATDPLAPGPYRALCKIFGWRRASDRVALAAGVLDWLGAANDEEKALLGQLPLRDSDAALADAAIDELLFDARVPVGFRNLFRLLEEPLNKLFRADLRRLGITRQERVHGNHPLRELAQELASGLGIASFELYITAAQPSSLVVELTDPLAIVLGRQLVDGAEERELRFLLGRCLKMIQCHLALPLRLAPQELGLLVGGIVRQFVPDFVPAGFTEPQLVAEATRLARSIPRRLHGELLPFALECASPNFDLLQIGPALVQSANRAGWLCCGLPGPALTAVRRVGDEAQLRAMLRFAVSDELFELRRQLGLSRS